MIRQAETGDFSAIAAIRAANALNIDQLDEDDYRVQVQRTGFLLPDPLPFKDFHANVANYLLAERGGQVAGYLRLSEDKDISPEVEAFWHRCDLRDAYYADPHANIWGVGVLPKARQSGVATELLQAAERRIRAKNIPWLFSEIITSPVTNTASLLFHEKNGFKRVALVNPVSEAYGMKGFQYLLYGKQLLSD